MDKGGRGMYLIGIDLGTTGVKAVIFTEEGQIAAMEYEAYRQESVKGKRQLYATALWESCERVLAAALARCPSQEEGALCVSSFGEGFVSGRGRPGVKPGDAFDRRPGPGRI